MGDPVTRTQAHINARPTIAYLGPLHTRTHIAARRAWGDAAFTAKGTVSETIDALTAGQCDFAMMPFENTIDGIIPATVDHLVFHTVDVEVVGELSVRSGWTHYRGDHIGVYTRFACVGRQGSEPDGFTVDGLARWKTTLALTPHTARPGVLAEVCTRLFDLGVDILSLSSRPLPGHPGGYVFVLSVAGRADQTNIVNAVYAVLCAGVSVKYLGSYPSDDASTGISTGPFRAPTGSHDLLELHKIPMRFSTPGALVADLTE